MGNNLFEQAYGQLDDELPMRQFGGNESARIAYGISRTERFFQIADELKVRDSVLPQVDQITASEEGGENNG